MFSVGQLQFIDSLQFMTIFSHIYHIYDYSQRNLEGTYGCARLCAKCWEVPGACTEQRESWH